MLTKGRPFEKGNKCGRGRPRGSRNKKTLLAQELLDSHGPALIRSALLKALKGDAPLMRALLSHVLPRRTSVPVKIGPLPMATAEELSQTSQHVLNKVAAGQIAPSEGRDISALLEAHRKIIETEEFDKRLRAVEERLQDQPTSDA
jgi:hypothetical protein